jgi:ABC-type proline/glycine betaine transport system ATPase subunit
MPCSKILVMDKGCLVQQGSPHDLIREPGGKFESLCKAAGEEEFQHLLNLAGSASEERDDVHKADMLL